MEKLPYLNIIGKLWWHCANLRPSACYCMSVLSRSLHSYTQKHFKIALHLLRWLHSKADEPYVLGRRAGRSMAKSLYCYCDADFANCVESRRSNTGVLIFLDGSLIQFFSRRQTGIAISTTDAEVRSATAACKEIFQDTADVGRSAPPR